MSVERGGPVRAAIDDGRPRWGSRRLWDAAGPAAYARAVGLRAAVRRPLVARRARAAADALDSSSEAGARRLAALLRTLVADEIDPHDAVPLALVEAGRHRILRSTRTVEWVDGRRTPVAWICARASQPPAGARLLFHAVRQWRPTTVVELGTCVGVSGGYAASALMLNGSGRLVSIEGYPGLAEQARLLWRGAGLGAAEVVVGRFADRLTEVLARAPVDCAFVDGAHSGAATVRSVEAIARAASPGALLVLDDIDYSPGMRRGWAEVAAREDVVASADLGKIGLVVLA